METKYKHRNCPICKIESAKIPEIIAENEAESLIFSEAKSYWVGLFNKKSHFSYYRCNICGLLYNKYYFTDEQLRELYSNLEPNMNEVNKTLLIKTQKGYSDIFKKFSKKKRNYLEIGPDIGLFLESDKKNLGNYNNYYMYEPNIQVHKQLGELIQKSKLNISQDMLGFHELNDGSIDDVVMIHVFDHMVEPLEIIKSLHQKMVVGGTILIVTHNESSLLKKLSGKKWPPLCLQHPQVYNSKTIRKILEKAGFSIEYIGATKNFFSINYLIKHFLWLLGIKWKDIRLLQDISIGLYLGNIITIAKK
jgi:2-polyprenyl-3-methyl-5-hydroxy-6-metoxy-1,4-benzoquinol methylase